MGESVLENILEPGSGLEAGRTYMYLLHSGKVSSTPSRQCLYVL
jgi:hypothetical protein